MSRVLRPNNPFTTKAIYDFDKFYGRYNELSDCCDQLRFSGEGIDYIFVAGEQRVGKTSFNNIIGKIASGDHRFFTSDLSFFTCETSFKQTRTLDECLGQIINSILAKDVKLLKRFNIDSITAGVGVSAKAPILGVEFTIKPEFTFNLTPKNIELIDKFVEIVKYIFNQRKYIDKTGILIIVDDVDEFISKNDFAGFIKILDEMLVRSGIHNVKLMVTGTILSYEKMIADETAISDMKLIEINKFSYPRICHYLIEILNKEKLQVSDLVLEMIFNITEGLMYDVQDIFTQLLKMKKDNTDIVTIMDFETALKTVQETRKRAFKVIIENNLDFNHKDLLLKLMKQDEPATLMQLQSEFPKEQKKFVINYLNKLITLDFAIKDADKYCIKNKLIKDCLNELKSLYEGEGIHDKLC